MSILCGYLETIHARTLLTSSVDNIARSIGLVQQSSSNIGFVVSRRGSTLDVVNEAEGLLGCAAMILLELEYSGLGAVSQTTASQKLSLVTPALTVAEVKVLHGLGSYTSLRICRPVE